jgi:ribosome-binding protein aMBF1 (putative translation factor)
MIKNEKQYLITKNSINDFKKAIEQSQKTKEKMNHVIFNAMIEGINSQIEDLENEVKEYENLKTKNEITVNNLNEIPLALIKARISRGLSQEKLAELLNVKQQQIQKYEATNYAGVGFERIIEIGDVLGLELKNKVIFSLINKKMSRTGHKKPLTARPEEEIRSTS